MGEGVFGLEVIRFMEVLDDFHRGHRFCFWIRACRSEEICNEGLDSVARLVDWLEVIDWVLV